MQTFAITVGTAAILLAAAPVPRWEAQASGVTARLRGISAASDKVVWASGANSTVLRTADGGATWEKLTVPDAQRLDFRDIDAVSETSAYALSIGAGAASRIYKTTDAGAHWQLQFTNDDPKAFFDAMAFSAAMRLLHVLSSTRSVYIYLVDKIKKGERWPIPIA